MPLSAGPQELSIQLTSASLADTMASGSTYAAHDLGGITRKIYLMVLPELSIADVNYNATVRENRRTENDRFTKTGSGQT